MTLLLVVGLLASACGSDTVETEATASPSDTGSASASPTPTDTNSPTPTTSPSPTPTSGATAGSTSSPTPAADPLDRTSLTLDASGQSFTETPVAAAPRADTGGDCPVAEPSTTASIIGCAEANAEAGGIAVTVEEAGDRFHATIWKAISSGAQWEAVSQTPIWTRGDGGSGDVPPDRVVPEATQHTLGFNVIDVGFAIGGSGGFWDHQVVDWARGESDPSVAYTIARPSPTVTWQAGKMVVDAPHLADGDANCCPSEREVVVVERPMGRSSVPAVSTIVPRGADTPELLAAEVYRAWLDGSVGSVPNSRLASDARSYLNGNPSGGQDVHGFSQTTCPWDGTRYACEFGSTGNTMTWRIEPTPAGTHQLVEIVEGSP